MENLNQFVSFWGGIASLVALALTLAGGFFAFLRWGHKRREAEFAKLAELRNTIADRARSATTQGKRVDLFVYYQSLLSNRRFSHTVREIQAATIHVISCAFAVVFLLKESDATYFSDQFLPPPAFMRDNYQYIMPVQLGILFVLNVLIRSKLAKEHRRLRHSAKGLTDELENYLTTNNG